MSGIQSEKKLLYTLKVKADPDAFAALYDIYVKQIYRFVYFKVSDHEAAEDITSEVFLKAWHYIQAHTEIKSFRGLLYRIARNCIIDLYRARSAKPEIIIDVENEPGDEGAWIEGIVSTIENKKILDAIKRLKQEYQEVITLRYVDELEISEIAEIIGKGSITVRVTIHRALNKLKQIVGEE